MKNVKKYKNVRPTEAARVLRNVVTVYCPCVSTPPRRHAQTVDLS
jgi:hypothetical protein